MRNDQSYAGNSNLLPSPEQLFPGWRSIELFGVPGAGKSHYCREMLKSHEIFSTCENQIVRYFVDARMGRFMKVMSAITSRRAFKNYYQFRKKLMVRQYLARAEKDVNSFLHAVEKVIELSDISAGTKKNIRKSVGYSAASLSIAAEFRLKILIDEGLLRAFLAVVERSKTRSLTPMLNSAVKDALKSYPWERNALLMEASQSIALARQVSRGLIISTEARPIERSYEGNQILSELLLQSGWKLCRVNTET